MSQITQTEKRPFVASRDPQILGSGSESRERTPVFIPAHIGRSSAPAQPPMLDDLAEFFRLF